MAQRPIVGTVVGGLAPATVPEMRAADANRIFYADHAATYDRSEHCAHAAGPRELLARLLARAVECSPSASPQTLDACGGTGNVSELLASQGIETTVVDVSAPMLDQWRLKAAALGVATEVVESEVGGFLLGDERFWDLIVFSSALHHLDDPDAALELAIEHLAPGGVLVTAFDPIRNGGGATTRLRRLDYLFSLFREPRALGEALGRRRKRRAAGGLNVGDIAEKHALEGLDDQHIIGLLEDSGMEMIEHGRYAYTRFALTQALFAAMGRPTTFHLIARKLGPDPATDFAS